MFDENDIRFKNFITDYVDIISSDYNRHEQKRFHYLKINTIVGLLTAVFLICITILCFHIPEYSILMLVVLIVPFTVLLPNKKKYSSYLKNEIVYTLLKKHCNIVQISPYPGRIILESGLFPADSWYAETDDCFEGIYNNTKYQIYETAINYGTGRSQQQVFKGVIFLFGNHKGLPNNLVISAKNIFLDRILIFLIILVFLYLCTFFALSFLNIIKNPNIGFFELFLPAIMMAVPFFAIEIINRNRLSKVKLNSREFMKYYNVKAESSEEAQRAITPELMQKLLNFKHSFGGKRISFAVYQNMIILAVESGRDLFEIGELKTPLKNSKSVYKFYNEINAIFKMIDYFKLDEKTGL